MNTSNNIFIKQDVFVKHKYHDNGQFQWWPRSQGQIPWYQYKVAHVQGENYNFHYFFMKTVYFFKKISQISRSKSLVATKGSYPKEYSCEVWNFWHTLEKIFTRLTFSEKKSNTKIQVTWWKILEFSERSCHKENSC